MRRGGGGKDRGSFDHVPSHRVQQSSSYACRNGYLIHGTASTSYLVFTGKETSYWISQLSAKKCQPKIDIFLIFLPGHGIFSYFWEMSFYMTDLDNHLQACFWASGSSELFLLKSFSPVGQREIWRQAWHTSADVTEAEMHEVAQLTILLNSVSEQYQAWAVSPPLISSWLIQTL